MYNLVVMYKPLAELLPISTLTQIYYNCAALKAFGADLPTRHDENSVKQRNQIKNDEIFE